VQYLEVSYKLLTLEKRKCMPGRSLIIYRFALFLPNPIRTPKSILSQSLPRKFRDRTSKLSREDKNNEMGISNFSWGSATWPTVNPYCLQPIDDDELFLTVEIFGVELIVNLVFFDENSVVSGFDVKSC
jgi:hypothetical protein